MEERKLLRPTSLLWFCVIFLSFAEPAASSAAGQKVPAQQRNEVSSITLHVPIPLLALSQVYNGIHRDFASQRTTTREWIPLGGGTGFLKYRIWPGDQDSKTEGGRLVSRATFPFGVEYAKPLNGSPTKISECGHSDARGGAGRLSVQLATAFAQGRGYGVIPKSRVTTIEPAGSCLLSNQNVDAAPLMAQVYRSELLRVLPAVDRKAVGLVSLKPAVERIWKDLQEPMLLDEAESVWLLVHPESIGAAGLGVLSESPAAAFGVTARPTVLRGARPVSSPSPLPEAQDHFHDDGFHVTFTLQVPMEEANQRLRQAVVGQEWSLGVGMIKIAGATLYPMGKQVGVELTLRGLLPLTLRLTGTPTYDEPMGRILFREVNYNIKGRTPATDLAEEWLHEPLREELARRLVVPIREELNLMRKALEKGVNREMMGGRLRGTVQQLLLKDLIVQTDSLSATFKTDGTLLYLAHADSLSP
jgi:hypothetical protein